jgi:ABC-2 type transport system permease protein
MMQRLSGWRHYLGAIWAIFRKDVLVFLSYPMNAVMRLIEPVMWITPVYFLSRAFAVDGRNIGLEAFSGTTDYMAFLILGSFISSFVSAVFWGMGYSLKNEMDAGVLESNWLAPVPVMVQLIGRSLYSLFITVLNGVSIGLIVWLLFGFEIVGPLIPALLIMLPLLIALYGFGFGLAGVVLVTNNANNVIDIVSNNITVLSGSQFPITVLPRPIMAISLALPLTYAYDAIRGILLGTSTLMPLTQEVWLLIGFMLISFSLGYAVFRRVERHCRTLGTLSQH